MADSHTAGVNSTPAQQAVDEATNAPAEAMFETIRETEQATAAKSAELAGDVSKGKA